MIVSGLSRDKQRLEIARVLGVDEVVDIGQDYLAARVRAITDGRGVALSIDAASGPDTLVKAMRLTRKNRSVLLAAAPSTTPPEFHVSDLLAGRRTLRPCRRSIASGRSPRHLTATHRFELADVDLAVRSVGAKGAPGAVPVTVLPWS